LLKIVQLFPVLLKEPNVGASALGLIELDPEAAEAIAGLRANGKNEGVGQAF
jgi:hypothetical protein